MKGLPVQLLDDTTVITPEDLSRCDYSFLRRIKEVHGDLPPIKAKEFQGRRLSQLTHEHERWVQGDYRRRYSATFSQLDVGEMSSLADLHRAHLETLSELRSLRVISGGVLTKELAPTILLRSSPTVMMFDTVVRVVMERFARSADLVHLGADAHVLGHAIGRDATTGVVYFNNRRHHNHDTNTLFPIVENRLNHLLTLTRIDMDIHEAWGRDGIYACGFCAHCKAAAKEHDDIARVWGVRVASRETLHRHDISTIGDLTEQAQPPFGVDRFTWSRLHQRAQLQHRAHNNGQPGFVIHNPAAINALPQPNPGDIFFDFEGDPLWVEKNRFEWGLEFLFGYIEADTGQYTALWAVNQAEEKQAFASFLSYLEQRRIQYPDMHIYHFAFYEPAMMRKLARRHRYGQKFIKTLIDTDVFVDLYEVVKNGVHTSGDSYGLKALESLYAPAEWRQGDLGDGSEAVELFNQGLRAKTKGDEAVWQESKAQLMAYNEADCLSTKLLRDWLLEHVKTEPQTPAQALQSLGARQITTELMITPLQEQQEDLSYLDLHAPGFDEPGIFYISSANSTDGKGPDHKTHTFHGWWGSGTVFSDIDDVMVVYADPTNSPTDATGMVARRATVVECTPASEGQILTLLETTPAHDPQTHHLVPVYATVSPPLTDGRTVLNRAKKLNFTVVTGPAGAGKTTRAEELTKTYPEAVVIDDAHHVSLVQALTTIGDATHVIVAGDPDLAPPINPRAFPVDEAHGPLLSWLLGDSGATINKHEKLTTSFRFHPRQADLLNTLVYPQTHFEAPELALLTPEYEGLYVHTVDHWARRGLSPEEAITVVQVVEQTLKTTPLSPAELLVTAIDDAQALLLRHYLQQWPELRVRPLSDCLGEEAALVVVSLGVSTFADLPTAAARLPFAPHVLAQALSRAQEASHIVCSSRLLTQLPQRTGWFRDIARFASLTHTAR